MDRFKKRLTFSKTGRMRFVGYLDMLRVIQRAMARAKIDLVYSQGFNPHPQMSFAQPLSLGVMGVREYMDLELSVQVENEILISRINKELPPGLQMKECVDIPEGMKTAMALSHIARYVIDLPEEFSEIYPEKLKSFNELETVCIQKISKSHGKKVQAELDLKPMIVSLNLTGPTTLELYCICDCARNTKPDRLMKVFWINAGMEEQIGSEMICRMDLYHEGEKGRVSLMDLTVQNQ